MKFVLVYLVALAPCFLAGGAASAASIEDCEKIQEAGAYNLCLASFGPKRGEQPRAAAQPADPEASVPPGQRQNLHSQSPAPHGSVAHGRWAGRHHVQQTHPHTVLGASRNKAGRMSLVFDIGHGGQHGKNGLR